MTTPIDKPIRASEIRSTFSRIVGNDTSPVSLSQYQGLRVSKAKPETGQFDGYDTLPTETISYSDFIDRYDFFYPYVDPVIQIRAI